MAQQKYWDGTQWVPVASKITIPTLENPPANPNDGDMYFQVNEGYSLPIISSGNLVEKKVVTADCSSVTFTGLDSLVDGDYYLDMNLTPTNIENVDIYLKINGDSSNFIGQGLYVVNGASTLGYEFTNNGITHKVSNRPVLSRVEVKKVANQVLIAVVNNRHNDANDNANLMIEHRYLVYSGSITSITSLELYASLATFGVGAVLSLYKSNSAQQLVPYNPVDITSRTSDYLLKPGEVVYIDYTNATSVPLRVATQEGEYEITLSGDTSISVSNDNSFTLKPNNVTNSNIHSFYDVAVSPNYHPNPWEDIYGTSFYSGESRIDKAFFFISTITKSKTCKNNSLCKKVSGTLRAVWNNYHVWNDTTTPWNSLGTLTFPFAQSGKIIIKRII